MASQRKIQYIESLLALLLKYPNFIIVDHDSLPHKTLEELREKLRETGDIKFTIVKNSLLKIALNKLNREKKTLKKEEEDLLTDNPLIGPSAILFLEGNWIQSLQVFHKFTKDYEDVKYKGGIVDKTLYFEEKLNKLATLPTKEELFAKILGSLKTPQMKTIYSMRYHAMKFVHVLREAGNK